MSALKVEEFQMDFDGLEALIKTELDANIVCWAYDGYDSQPDYGIKAEYT